MDNLLLGFLSGIFVTVIGAKADSKFRKKRDKAKRIEDVRFNVYMKLMDLYNLYFWFASAETRKEKVSKEVQQKVRELAWEVGYYLRTADEIEYLEDIMYVIFSNKYDSFKSRYNDMNLLLDKLGDLVNPRYSRIIKNISNENNQKIELNISTPDIIEKSKPPVAF